MRRNVGLLLTAVCLLALWTGDALADARTYPVSKAGTVEAVAARNRVNVEDFRRWNNLQAGEWLEKETPVYLEDPRPSGSQVHTRRPADDDPLAALGGSYDDGSVPAAYPGYVSNRRPNLSAKEKKALKLAGDYQDRPVAPFLAANGRVTYVYGATLPSVVCAPFMASDVELAPGETVNDVVLGDTARWKVVVATSGRDGRTTPHLVFKPVDAGLETMAVITTDQRTYHLKLLSQPRGHMSYVGFTYPEDGEQSIRQQVKQQQTQQQRARMQAPAAGVDLAGLDFSYNISGKASWKPTQVYNDGRQTFIRLPDVSKNTEIPVLLVRRAGTDVMVNYRVKDGALVVDELFQEAVLLAGVGGKQQRVTIKRGK